MSASTRRPASFAEFVVLISMLSAIGALSTDAIMPALPQMGAALGAVGDNSRQLPISTFFLGLALGQLLYGPIADSRGRKVAVFLGLGIYLVGCLVAYTAQSFEWLLWGRVIQGFGVAACRSVPMALVRDQYSGNLMARVMSFTQTVFILVPMLAPAYGQLILNLGGWRDIFLSFMVVATLLMVWFGLRQPETLRPENRIPFSWAALGQTVHQILQNKTVMGYTLASGFISGAFTGYLNTAQQLYQDLYHLGAKFTVYFALVALSLGLASLLNTGLVMKLGMRRIVLAALGWVMACSVAGLLLSLGGVPPLWVMLTYLMLSFFGVGLLFGNLSALAMQPLSKGAGLGASIVGALSTLLSVPIGAFIGQHYDATPRALMWGLLSMAAVALGLVLWVGKGEEEGAGV